jgi:spore germination cell wall hydrolase CwlJ-like protein
MNVIDSIGLRPLRLAYGLALAIAAAVPAAAQPPMLAQPEIDLSEELECLALTIYFEARGEPDEGKIAVGHVVMNRASHPLFPPDVCNVVRQGGIERHRCQFSWWCDGRSDRPRDWAAWEESKALAEEVFRQAAPDPTEGALWYHADYVRPSWQDKLHPGPKIGRHIFYKASDDTEDLVTTAAN